MQDDSPSESPLASPTHAVIGASDLDESCEFFRMFGFEVESRAALPAAAAASLYGLGGEMEEAVLRVEGAGLGWLRLVSTPRPTRQCAPLDHRAFTIDLFTTDLVLSIAVAAEAGYEASPVVEHQFGPVTIGEAGIKGPDGLVVTLLEQPVGRKPSVLDHDPMRHHSELHAFVWSVADMDALLPFWRWPAGLELLTDAKFSSPGMGEVLGVPGKELEMRLAVLADKESSPARLELIEFFGDEAAAEQPNWPLAAGLHAPAFTVDDLGSAIANLGDARFGEVAEIDSPLHPNARAVSAEAPGGLRFEIWQEG